jgi:hypothetical protein
LRKKYSSRRRAEATAAANPKPLAADDAVRHEWLRRVEAEYRSGAQAQHLTLWLWQLAAPPDLIEMGLRVASDELAHAELSAQVYAAAGGCAAPVLTRESLALPRSAPSLELDVLRVAVEMFCLGETVAVRLFSRLRDESSVAVARSALDRILRDEVVHRDFGWALLGWLLDTPLSHTFRESLARDLPSMLERVRQNYGGLALDQLGAEELARRGRSLPESARAWGVMPASEYVAAVAEAFARDYAPRFAALGISMPESHAGES